MLLKLLLKMSFKAFLPLAAVVGILSYSIYLKGGDPLVLAQGLRDSTLQKVSAVFDSVSVSSRAALSSLGPDTAATDQVYRWTDASGVTHFTSAKPSGPVSAELIHMNPDQNMIAGSRARPAETAQNPLSEPLPGAAGIALPGLDRSELLGQRP